MHETGRGDVTKNGKQGKERPGRAIAMIGENSLESVGRENPEISI